MAEFKMPELNTVIVAGNLTKDPIFRQTTNGTPVVNFSIASNRRFRDKNDEWKEDVCYVGIVAWNRLAESCREAIFFYPMSLLSIESDKISPKKIHLFILQNKFLPRKDEISIFDRNGRI